MSLDKVFAVSGTSGFFDIIDELPITSRIRLMKILEPHLLREIEDLPEDDKEIFIENNFIDDDTFDEIVGRKEQEIIHTRKQIDDIYVKLGDPQNIEDVNKTHMKVIDQLKEKLNKQKDILASMNDLKDVKISELDEDDFIPSDDEDEV